MAGSKTGRPRKPTALKKLAGTHRKDRAPKHEPKPRGGVRPPKGLSVAATAEWNRLAPELERLGLLTVADRAMFAIYCDAVARWTDLTQRLDKGGLTEEQGKNGYRQQVAEVALQKSYGEIIARLASRFGLDPSARAGLDVLPGNLSATDASEEEEAGKQEGVLSLLDRRLKKGGT